MKDEDTIEQKRIIQTNQTKNMCTESTYGSIINKYSSMTKLKRVTAYCRRFIDNSRKPQGERVTDYLTSKELHQSLLCCIVQVQRHKFSEIISCLSSGKALSKQLLSLSPFIDNTDVLRVGGRLKNSKLPYDQRHPILLPNGNHLTNIIIMDEHVRMLHAGPQLLLASLQQKYWIVNARNIIRQLIHKCISCTRYRAMSMEQQMSDLPLCQTEPASPFLRTGVDYGGPFNIKSIKGRGGKILKSYVSLFVCMSTKAIHLELITDLTSEAFLAALSRFMARRGKPSDVFSDNATNFTAANTELKELGQLLKSQPFQEAISTKLTNQGINWHFIPASGPHFGGLWEAGIRSMKKHLRRVVGDQTLTFEEFYTLLTQVESCLNSRPLCQMSTDPNDNSALTPGHFLIGEPLTSTPEHDLTQLKVNRLSRWQYLQQLSQHFWKRWNSEYIVQMQQRQKWKIQHDNLKIGDLVLIKEDNTPPKKWHMGRVIFLHPGKDNLVRAVTVKTANSTLKRPIVKLCLLPIS